MKEAPTMNLTDIRCKGYDKDHFRIDTMKGTIDYQAGGYISSTEVQDLINRNWHINIKSV